MNAACFLAWAVLMTVAFAPGSTLAQSVLPQAVPKAPAQATPDPTLLLVKNRLQSVLQIYQPNATVAIQPTVSDDNTLIAEYQTQKFLVYDRFMTGEITSKPRVEIGPNYQGFRLELTVRPGKYDGQAVVPQDLHEPYWQTYIASVPLKGRTRYLWVSLSYGVRTNREMLAKMKQVVSAAQ